MPTQSFFNHPTIGFVAGTPLLTPNGSLAIENVQPGDFIQFKPADIPDNEPEEKQLPIEPEPE